VRQARPLNRGYLLLLTIGLVGLLFALGLAVVQFATHHQQWVRKAESEALAREAARGGLHTALARVAADPSWREGLDEIAVGAGTASLTFSGSNGVPASTANSGTSALQGDGGRTVPAGALHLICRGRSGASTAWEEAIVAPPGLLYENDFSSNAAEWTQSILQPIVLAGHYVLSLNLELTAMTGADTWRDYEAEFQAQVTQGTGLGFLVRASGAPSTPSGYLVDFQLLDGRFHLYKLQDGQPTLLRQAPGGLGNLLGLSHTYVVRAQGPTITVTVDGSELFSYTDPSPIENGAIGIRPLLGSVALIDSVRVRQLFQVVSTWRR
jgi:hypothetical protein